MKARDFLDVADQLLEGSTEAAWRSDVSRAYYATFHVARLLFQQFGFSVPETDQAHHYLCLRLANCGHPDVKVTGNALNFLRTVRNKADYDLAIDLSHHVAFGYVNEAEQIIDALETLAGEKNLWSPIIDAIRKYERDVLRTPSFRP